MLISFWVILLAAIIMIFFSVKERIYLFSYRDKDWDVIGESKSSPISRAITNLIGMAGGIYLSMVLFLTFIEANIPEKIHIGSVGLEPLATVAIVLAIIQPFILKLIQIRRRF